MRFFRYKEDRLPVLLITGLFALDLVLYLHATSMLTLAFWLLLVTGPKACICAWNHHHQHLPTFYQNILNRALEIIYALHTGISTHAWVLHHNLGHHLNYLDQSKDESRWKRTDGRTMTELEYTLKIAITGYLRAFKVGRAHPKYQTAFLGMALVVLSLVALFIYYNWINALFIFVIPMFIGYLITCWHTYAHHAGLDSDNHFEASHNIMHQFYNVMTGNLGYHTAHHIKPGIHWSRLPEFHTTIKDKIPAHLFVEPPLAFRILSPQNRARTEVAADS